MKRGEVWTANEGGGDVNRPRRVVIIQDHRFAATTSITICPLTTDPTQAPLLRLLVEPDPSNGLRRPSSLMVDKIRTIPRSTLGECIGQLDKEDTMRLGRAVMVFVGLAG